MEIIKGAGGLGLTFQSRFPARTKCICGRQARIAFVAAEEAGEDKYICHLHENNPNSFWLHDAAAFAVYLCSDVECAKATTLWNQG